jgi:hypothetical protein
MTSPAGAGLMTPRLRRSMTQRGLQFVMPRSARRHRSGAGREVIKVGKADEIMPAQRASSHGDRDEEF